MCGNFLYFWASYTPKRIALTVRELCVIPRVRAAALIEGDASITFLNSESFIPAFYHEREWKYSTFYIRYYLLRKN